MMKKISRHTMIGMAIVLIMSVGVWYGSILSSEQDFARTSDSSPSPHQPRPRNAASWTNRTGPASIDTRGPEYPEASNVRIIVEQDWSRLDAEQRVLSSKADFERALAASPHNRELAAAALSVLRSDLLPDRREEYEELERRFDEFE
ncbi:hypothetical protein ACNOYE_03610 [Nannocystaceae bacterium ST9]